MVEALGSIQKLDDEMVKRVLPFVFNGLNPSMLGCRDTKVFFSLVNVYLYSIQTTLKTIEKYLSDFWINMVTNLLSSIHHSDKVNVQLFFPKI